MQIREHIVGGKYQLLGTVASGGMGAVYRARHVRLNRLVAIKLMHERHFDNREYMTRFRREARRVAALQHPGIVEVRDFGEDERLGPYLEMELLEGFSLRGLMMAAGPLPIEIVVHCLVECLDALEYAHRRGILHRDLKPANLFITRGAGTFQTKILDFGLAKALLDDAGASGADTLTKTGVVLGTLTYMSPEHFTDFKSVDARSDVYSLSAAGFEMLTGVPVVSGRSLMECVDAVTRGHYHQHPARIRPGLSDHYDAIIARGLAKDRADRFGSAAEMRAALIHAGYDRVQSLAAIERLVVEERVFDLRPNQARPSGFDPGLGSSVDVEVSVDLMAGTDDNDTTIVDQPVFAALHPPEGTFRAGRELNKERSVRPTHGRSAPTWFWVALAGLAVVLVAFWLTRQRMRRADVPPAPAVPRASDAARSGT